MIVKLLTEYHLEFLSLKGGCTGSFESTLVKMQHCWKSHATAQFSMYCTYCEKISTDIIAWVKVFRINPEFRILRLTFHRKSASKY